MSSAFQPLAKKIYRGNCLVCRLSDWQRAQLLTCFPYIKKGPDDKFLLWNHWSGLKQFDVSVTYSRSHVQPSFLWRKQLYLASCCPYHGILWCHTTCVSEQCSVLLHTDSWLHNYCSSNHDDQASVLFNYLLVQSCHMQLFLCRCFMVCTHKATACMNKTHNTCCPGA